MPSQEQFPSGQSILGRKGLTAAQAKRTEGTRQVLEPRDPKHALKRNFSRKSFYGNFWGSCGEDSTLFTAEVGPSILGIKILQVVRLKWKKKKREREKKGF